MSNSGPGDDTRGPSAWDDPSWSSSLSDSSLSRPDEDPPSPWSREAASRSDPAASGPTSPPSASPPSGDPYARPQPADPYATPSGYAGPYPASASSGAEPPRADRPDPGFDPQPTPPYGDGTFATSYGSPPPAYAIPSPSYGAPPPAYGSNPYDASAYQPAYGTSIPYGVAPVTHPKSTTALIFGILGIVFALSCGIGGLLGIPGIIQGRKARSEIDAQPGRYGGRSQAVAGIVTGVIGLVISAVVIVLLVAIVIARAGY